MNLFILMLMDIWVVFNLLSKNSAILNSVALVNILLFFLVNILLLHIYTHLRMEFLGYTVCILFLVAPCSDWHLVLPVFFHFSLSVGMYIIALGIYLHFTANS